MMNSFLPACSDNADVTLYLYPGNNIYKIEKILYVDRAAHDEIPFVDVLISHIQ